MKARYFHRRNPLEKYSNLLELLYSGIPAPVSEALEAFDKALGMAIEDALSRGQVKRYECRDSSRMGRLPFACGFTVCIIENDDREELARGYAFCSELDMFSRRYGRAKAYGRAFAELNHLQREQFLLRQRVEQEYAEVKQAAEIERRIEELVDLRLAELRNDAIVAAAYKTQPESATPANESPGFLSPGDYHGILLDAELENEEDEVATPDPEVTPYCDPRVG